MRIWKLSRVATWLILGCGSLVLDFYVASHAAQHTSEEEPREVQASAPRDTGMQADLVRLSEPLLRTFFPYRHELPQLPELMAGTALNRGNWSVAAPLLPQELLQAVRDGELAILIQKTSDLPVSPAYINATFAQPSQTQLDAEGMLSNYHAGLPFPLIDPADVQSGVKIAWNVRYADRGHSLKRWESFQVRSSGGEHQHGFSVVYTRAYGMHRAKPEENIADWQSEGVFSKEFMEVLYPSPSLTIHPHLGPTHLWARYDQETRPVGQWYVPKYTTVHRMEILPYNPQSSAWRFPILYEDLFGTYVSYFTWRLLEAKVALTPGFVHGTEAVFGGPRSGYPLDPWELRAVYLVEATPRRDAHPYGRKLFCFDQQTFAPLYVLLYDQEGELWRMGFYSYAHPESYPRAEDVRVPILIGRSWIDLKADSTMIALVEEAIYNAPVSPDFFSLANLLRRAQ